MRAECPNCKTSYDMTGKINGKNTATMICSVCNKQMEIYPGDWKNLYKLRVLLRQENSNG